MTTSSPPASAAVAVAHPSPVAVPASGAEAIVQVLADEGVEVIFGYSGGAILPVYDAVFRHNALHPREDGGESMPLVVPANEQGAGFMAAGYARASGKVGVAIVTSGPGATNMVTPVRDSMADSIPLVVICGQVGTASIGSDAFQEAPVSNIMGACAKHVFLVTDAAQLEATVRTAFTLARSGRPGPVVVDVPKDVQNAAIDWHGSGELLLGGYRSRLRTVEQASLSDTDCAAFFAALAQARRPLIYAGGGVIAAEASTALRDFVDAFGLPVTTTLMGLGAFDTADPRALHMLGMHGTAYANYAVEDCDFVLALGARFDDRVAGVPDRFAPGAKFIACTRFSSATWACQASSFGRKPWPRPYAVSRSSARFSGPTWCQSTCFTLPISAGSMSTWAMNFACGANLCGTPATRSSKRAPSASTKSQSSTA